VEEWFEMDTWVDTLAEHNAVEEWFEMDAWVDILEGSYHNSAFH
jgi:hypothetical protein